MSPFESKAEHEEEHIKEQKSRNKVSDSAEVPDALLVQVSHCQIIFRFGISANVRQKGRVFGSGNIPLDLRSGLEFLVDRVLLGSVRASDA